MKIKDGFVLREVAGSYVVVNLHGSADLRGMVTLNESGAFLWKILENGATEHALADALIAEYGIDELVARRDSALFVQKLKDANVLE